MRTDRTWERTLKENSEMKTNREGTQRRTETIEKIIKDIW